MIFIMSKNKVKRFTTCLAVIMTCVFMISVISLSEYQEESAVATSSGHILSEKKIEWGIKRGKEHKQPDLGSENKRIVDKYDGISMGNSEKPYISKLTSPAEIAIRITAPQVISTAVSLYEKPRIMSGSNITRQPYRKASPPKTVPIIATILMPFKIPNVIYETCENSEKMKSSYFFIGFFNTRCM